MRVLFLGLHNNKNVDLKHHIFQRVRELLRRASPNTERLIELQIESLKNEVSPVRLAFKFAAQESFEFFKSEMLRAHLFENDVSEIRRYCIRQALRVREEDSLFLELGVFRGKSINLFANEIKASLPNSKIFGFDSFKGIEEDWVGTPMVKGHFDLMGKLPSVAANVELRVGQVQDTLPVFLEEFGNRSVRFVHFDLDTYTPTRYALEVLRNRLEPGTILLFDELYGYPGWKDGEFKALQETIDPERYRYLAFAKCAVAIEIIK